MDSVNADAPSPSIQVQVPLEPVIAAFMANPCLQSVGETYQKPCIVLLKKNPHFWEEILSQKEEFTLILWLHQLPC